MNEINFRTLDLNLLRVFDALVTEGNATRAGERLGLTQSAVSHGLNRLRHELHDELFVRGGDGMRPTLRAVEIAPRLREGLMHLQRALTAAEFDPATSERLFTLGGTSYFRTILFPPVVARLRQLAPRAEIRIHPGDRGIADDLDAGRLDVVFGGFGRVPERYETETVFEESNVWAVSSRHYKGSEPMDIESLAALPHVVIDPHAGESSIVAGSIVDSGIEQRVMRDESALHAALATRGLKRRVGLTVPDANSALIIVGQSDMATLIPARLAARWLPLAVFKIFEPPYPTLPAPVDMLWHRAHGAHPAVAWLRAIVREVAAGL